MPSLDDRFELGRYEILEEIGRGGMGIVYRARQQDLGRDVALKLVRPDRVADPETFARFQREARAAAHVNDPGLVAIHEAGEHRGQWFLAMELVDGHGLDTALREGPLEPERAAEIVAAVARAVDRLHREGIVHRDLKPSNVLIDAAGRPRVTDFGLAKLSSEPGAGSSAGVIVGTPPYLAPEQVNRRYGEVGPRTDVYGLGAILYELLTGRPPVAEVAGGGPVSAILAAAEGTPSPPRRLRPAIPVDLERVCLRCLEKRPDKRYASAHALAEDLERFLAGEPTEATPPGPVARAVRIGRRHPALAARLVGMVAFWSIAAFDHFVLGVTGPAFFVTVTILLVAWSAWTLGLELVARRRPSTAAYLRTTGDWAAFTAILAVADATASPLVVVYPLVVLVAAFSMRTGIVAFSTALGMASYSLLIVHTAAAHPALEVGLDRHLLVFVTVGMTGVLVAALVGRTRSLMRYASRRRG